MESQPLQEQRDPNTIFIGRKPTMNYVLACLTHIQSGGEGITVKARGKAISRAVDVAQLITNRFATDIKVSSVVLSTDQVKSELTNGVSSVPAIVIKMSR